MTYARGEAATIDPKERRPQSVETPTIGHRFESTVIALDAYLHRHEDDSKPRFRRERAIVYSPTPVECSLARRALRKLTTDDRVADDLVLPATTLEITLEDVQSFVEGDREIPVGVDLADCALIALALVLAATRETVPNHERLRFRVLGRRLLEALVEADEDAIGADEIPL